MWITITEDHIKTRITGDELEAARTAALADNQPDPVADVVAQITREVRGYVAANPLNRIGQGQTIPDECLKSALALIVKELCGRLPGKVLLKDERQKANDDAVMFFRDVAAGKFRIEQPQVDTEEKISGPATQLVASRPRLATRERMQGL